MLLRNIALILIAANLGYAAYAQGWFALLSGEEASQREPARITQQINPDAVLIVPITSSPETIAISPQTACSASLTATSPATLERWLVYMGPYANKTLLDKKKAELARLKIEAAEVSKPSLRLGLSLGEYASKNEAKSTLQALSQQGIKTATVVLWGVTSQPPTTPIHCSTP